MQRAYSLEKTLMLGRIEGRKRREQQRMRWLDGITDSMDMGLGDGQGGLACCGLWGHKELDIRALLLSQPLPGRVIPTILTSERGQLPTYPIDGSIPLPGVQVGPL